MTNLRRTAGALLACFAMFGLFAPAAGADHAGEVVELSKSDGLKDGETITITWSGFQPGVDANFIVVGEFPITTLPDRMNMLEFGTVTAPTDANGAGTAEYVVEKDHGEDRLGDPLVCGPDYQCWLIVQQVPFTEGWYNGVEITFADDTVEETTTTAVEEESTTTEAPTTTEAATTTTEAAADDDEGDEEDEGDDSSNTGLIIGIVAAVAVLVGGSAYAMNKRKGDDTPAQQ